MKFFATPNSKNIIATLCIVTLEKSELAFILILYSHDMINNNNIDNNNNSSNNPHGIKIPGRYPTGDSYTSWSERDLLPWPVTFLEMVSR